MNCDLFISHVEEDEQDVRALAEVLRHRGYETWIYEENNLPGVSYLDWIIGALRECRAVVVLVSRATLPSEQVGHEISTAFENQKKFVPVLKGLSHAELKQARPEWCHAFGTAVDITLIQGAAAAVAERIAAGLWAMGIRPAATVVPVPPAGQAPPPLSAPAIEKAPLRAPPFHCGSIVPPDYYIDREEELAQARELIAAHQSFLLAGDLRSGKTSFCRKIIAEMLEGGKKGSLPVYLNLQNCLSQEKGSFLSHTVLSIVGEAARVVFNRKYTDMLGLAAGTPSRAEAEDTAFREFVTIFKFVRSLTHTDSEDKAPDVGGDDFIRMTNDLAEVIAARGWGGVTVFFDEANKLPGKLPVELLVANEEQLAASKVTSIYVANHAMIEFFDPLLETFGNRISLRPFRNMKEMQQLLARYYWGDISRTADVPIAPGANKLLWEATLGRPYAIQLVARRSFALACAEGAAFVSEAHVRKGQAEALAQFPELFDVKRNA
ncbi:MAG: TIR domain-containing protein [Planctomycetota bacterium]